MDASSTTTIQTGNGTHTAVSAEASASSLHTHKQSHSPHLIHTKQQHTKHIIEKIPMSSRGREEAFHCGDCESVGDDRVLFIVRGAKFSGCLITFPIKKTQNFGEWGADGH